MTDKQQDFLKNGFLEVLERCVEKIGGPKKVGYILMERQVWEPQNDPGKVVTDCLNPKIRRKFGPEEIEVILLEARKADFHAGMEYLANLCFYQRPTPVSAQQTISSLTDKFEHIASNTSEQLKSIEMEIRRAREEFGDRI